MNTKNIALLIFGVIVVGVVIFFSTKGTTKAPTISPLLSTATSGAVVIKNYQFNPASLTLKKGGVVTWTNNDAALHIVAGDQATWAAGPTLKKGDVYTHTFDTSGVFSYHCAIHPNMYGTITVTE